MILYHWTSLEAYVKILNSGYLKSMFFDDWIYFTDSKKVATAYWYKFWQNKICCCISIDTNKLKNHWWLLLEHKEPICKLLWVRTFYVYKKDIEIHLLKFDFFENKTCKKL